MDLVTILDELMGGDDLLAEAAVQRLARLPEADQLTALAALRQLSAASEADQRWWAARALAELPVEQTGSLLAQALKDPDPSVRQCAALGLRLQIMRPSGWNPAPDILDLLLGGLGDSDPLAARLAADALAAIGEPAVPQLLELLSDNSHRDGRYQARSLVVRCLAKIGDQRAIPSLLAVLDEDSLLMEYWANEGLDKMGLGMAYFLP